MESRISLVEPSDVLWEQVGKIFPLISCITQQLENLNPAQPNPSVPDPFLVPQLCPSAYGMWETHSSPHFHRLPIQANACQGMPANTRAPQSQQQESSCPGQSRFCFVALYFLVTAKKSGRDIQRDSGVTNNIPEPQVHWKVQNSVPSRAFVAAAVVSDSPLPT